MHVLIGIAFMSFVVLNLALMVGYLFHLRSQRDAAVLLAPVRVAAHRRRVPR